MRNKKFLLFGLFSILCLSSCSRANSFESFIKRFREIYPQLSFVYVDGPAYYKYSGDITSYNKNDQIISKKEFNLLGKGICSFMCDIQFNEESSYFILNEDEHFYKEEVETSSLSKTLLVNNKEYKKIKEEKEDELVVNNEVTYGTFKDCYLDTPIEISFFKWGINNNESDENSNISGLDFAIEDSNYLIFGEYLQNYDNAGTFTSEFSATFDFDYNYLNSTCIRNYTYQVNNEDDVAKKEVKVKLEFVDDVSEPSIEKNGVEKDEELICIQWL